MQATLLEARLIERTLVAPDLARFRFAKPDGYAFLPGQFAVLGLPTPEGHTERAYSIASAPHEPELEFFIERVPQGRLTPRLFALAPGEVASLRPAARGRMLLDPGAKSHLMVATVTGVAPFISMIRDLAVRDSRPEVYVVHGASHSPELGFREELEALAQGWLRYRPTVSRPQEDPGWAGSQGRADAILEQACLEWKLDPRLTAAYLCGHPGMVGNAKVVLARLGFVAERVRSESW